MNQTTLLFAHMSEHFCFVPLAEETLDVEAKLKNSKNRMKTILDDDM